MNITKIDGKPLLISQSLIKKVLKQDVCPLSVKFNFIDQIESPPSEVMMRGKYFEYNLIGACRGDEVPELKKLKKGGKSKAEQDLDETILGAKIILDELGLDLKKAKVQKELISGELSGHLDIIAPDIMRADREAIYDIKYTETKYDDRWNGWADFDNKLDEKIQASHYIKLYQRKYGNYVPYYFLVFGKSGWSRVIKVVVTEQTMTYHDVRISATKEKLLGWERTGWPANPEFNRCADCAFIDRCDSVSTKPDIEVFQI